MSRVKRPSCRRCPASPLPLEPVHDLRRQLRRLEPVGEQEKARWKQLLEFAILWSVRRRPKEERERLYTEGLKNYQNAAFLQEVKAMAEAEVKTWEEELTEIIRSRTELQTTRKILRSLLEKRFGPLPQPWTQRIESTSDLNRLTDAIAEVGSIQTLDDLKL